MVLKYKITLFREDTQIKGVETRIETRMETLFEMLRAESFRG